MLIIEDIDFVRLIEDHGLPLWVVLMTCGKHVDTPAPAGTPPLVARTLELLRFGERLVEIGDAPHPDA